MIYAVIWNIFRIFTPSIKRMTMFKKTDHHEIKIIYIMFCRVLCEKNT